MHVEFVKDRTPNLDLRMMTYRVRLRGHDGDRDTPITQYMLVIGDHVPVPDHYHDVDAPHRGSGGRSCALRNWIQ